MHYLTYRLDILSQAAIKAADPYYFQAVGLRVRELRVLRLLHEMPGCTATVLRERLEVDKTLLSKNLSALEQRGLITRSPHPEDSRSQCLQLSAEGQRVWEVCEHIGHRLEQDMFAGLSEEKWQELHRLLKLAYESFRHWQESGREHPQGGAKTHGRNRHIPLAANGSPPPA